MHMTRPALRTCLWALLALTPLGCATRQQLLEMETEFKGRMATMEAGLAVEKKRVDTLNTQVNELNAQLSAVRATATEATRIGTDARQRADAATAKVDAVDVRVASALADRFKRMPVKEFRVTFETGRAELSGPAQSSILDAVKVLADNPTYSADVVGYTDDVGAAGSNVNLSWRREEAVRRFMVQRGTELNRFSFIGLGEDRARGTTETARARDRHVLVKIYRPAE
jgi:outer membrane protein OmpA-like peptidoglycan-associated protein